MPKSFPGTGSWSVLLAYLHSNNYMLGRIEKRCRAIFKPLQGEPRHEHSLVIVGIFALWNSQVLHWQLNIISMSSNRIWAFWIALHFCTKLTATLAARNVIGLHACKGQCLFLRHYSSCSYCFYNIFVVSNMSYVKVAVIGTTIMTQMIFVRALTRCSKNHHIDSFSHVQVTTHWLLATKLCMLRLSATISSSNTLDSPWIWTFITLFRTI